MNFEKRYGTNMELCQSQREALATNATTKDLFDFEAIIKKSAASTEKYFLNNFDECLRFTQDVGKDGVEIKGKYCVTSYNSTSSPNIKYMAACFPDSCSDVLLKRAAEDSLKANELTLQRQWCQTAHLEYEIVDYVSVALFALLAVIVIVSTLYDFFKKKDGSKKRCMTTFSLCSNVKKIFKTSSGDDEMNCLYALRALSVFWLIVANRFGTMATFPLSNEATYNDWLLNGFSAFVTNSDVAYDTFFMVSGFLLTTYCMRAYAMKSMNYFHVLIHRYFRYVPLLCATILYYISIFKFTVRGPMVHRLGPRIDHCKEYWWTTVLLVENYVTPNNTCLFDAWYFNVDFQFFILLPLLVWIYFQSRKIGIALLYTILIAIYTAAITILIVYEMPYNVVESITPLPIHSHFRCAPWIISIFLASLCLKDEVKMAKSSRALCWLVTYAIFIAYFVTVYLLQNEKYAADSIPTGAVFAGLHRILWSIAIAWIIFACVKLESDGIVRKFLSSPVWKPLGKLSITLLIIHPVYQVATTYSLKSPYDFDSWMTFHMALGDIVFTTFLAVFLYASIELPFVAIEQSFHRRRSEREEIEGNLFQFEREP